MNPAYFITLFVMFTLTAFSQSEKPSVPAKVSHAEPIYFDLIRDLGARRGEKELNVGIGMARFDNYSIHSYLVEYEFAPLNRLGMELEIPIVFHTAMSEEASAQHHGDDGLEGIKAAFQYSFFVSEKLQTTMALGYIFETRRKGFDLFRSTGSIHNPFFIVAKKWGSEFHTLIYTGPSYEYDRETGRLTTALLLNTSIHYFIPRTKNFVGVEMNQEIHHRHFEIMVRPQVKMVLSKQTSLGLAIGIPAWENDRNLDFLVRLIYEPRKKN
jgi:hypothetical protein